MCANTGFTRAEDETRTRDPDLGKVVLYQLSYFCGWYWILLFALAGAKIRRVWEMAKHFAKKV